MTLGKKNCREGVNVCMNYEFNLLHHAGVVDKRVHAAAEKRAAHKGDDDTHSGRGVKTSGQSGNSNIEVIFLPKHLARLAEGCLNTIKIHL